MATEAQKQAAAESFLSRFSSFNDPGALDAWNELAKIGATSLMGFQPVPAGTDAEGNITGYAAQSTKEAGAANGGQFNLDPSGAFPGTGSNSATSFGWTPPADTSGGVKGFWNDGGSQIAGMALSAYGAGSGAFGAPDAAQPGVFDAAASGVSPTYQYLAGPASGAGSVSSTVTPLGGGDAIENLARLSQANPNMTISEAARSAGYSSPEAYLNSIDPSFLSGAGAAALTGGAAASGAAWGGAGASGGIGSATLASLAPALIAGGASIAGGALAAKATGKAVDAQTAASDRALQVEQQQYNQNRADLAPYREAGSATLPALMRGVGVNPGGDPSTAPLTRKFAQSDLEADPVYNSGLKFGADQGRDAINARAVQAGNYDSGATLKALTRFGNDYGSTKANDSYTRFTGDQNSTYGKLMGTAGLGVNATNTTVNAGTTQSGNIASTITGQGNAQAAGSVGTANAWGNALTGVGSAANNYQNSQTLAALLGRGEDRAAAQRGP